MSEPITLLIIGGGPAALSAARAYREAGVRGSVAILADEQRMPYRRPPLTKELLRGEVDESELPIEPESWLHEHDVRLISGRATSIDADERTVAVSGGRTLRYETCLIATGAEPKRIPAPGVDDPGVRALRSLDDLRELNQRLTSEEPVTVVGSGFIGCEIAASLRMRGHPVTLISDEPAPNAARLGDEAADRIAGWLEAQGVTLHLETPLDAVERDGDGLTVCAGPVRVPARVVVMAAGVVPRAELAECAGITLTDGAIPVDSGMRTDRSGVLAAGDVCLAMNDAAGRRLHVEHWGDALAQGEVAGRAAAGVPATWDTVPGFWSTIGERTLKYAAWGDGFDVAQLTDRDGDGFTVTYARAGRLVGILAHQADDDYERGQAAILDGAR